MTSRSRLFLVVSALAAGCGASASDTSAVTSLTGDAASGRATFGAQCQSCHGADGTSGTAKRPVPNEAKTNLDGAVTTILDGEGEMPAFSATLSSQDIANVLAYVKTL